MIMDVLTSDITVVGSADFLAAAAPPVDLFVTPPPAGGLVFSNAAGRTWFESGDNILVNRISCGIPFGFGQGAGIHQLLIQYKDPALVLTNVSEFAEIGDLTIPTLCDGLDFPGGLFLQVPIALTRFQMVLSGASLKASMVNLPAVLVGQTIKVAWYIEILHTRGMQIAP